MFNSCSYPYPSRRTVVYAKNAMACTSVPLGAQIGLDVMKAGGNAVDAAIAMAAAMPTPALTASGSAPAASGAANAPTVQPAVNTPAQRQRSPGQRQAAARLPIATASAAKASVGPDAVMAAANAMLKTAVCSSVPPMAAHSPAPAASARPGAKGPTAQRCKQAVTAASHRQTPRGSRA